MQQIRQIPIFLGRRKRSFSVGDGDEEPANALGHRASDTDRDSRDEDIISNHETADHPPLLRADGSRMEEIKFVLNGKEEKFVIAKEVEAVVDHFADQEDSDFGL